MQSDSSGSQYKSYRFNINTYVKPLLQRIYDWCDQTKENVLKHLTGVIRKQKNNATSNKSPKIECWPSPLATCTTHTTLQSLDRRLVEKAESLLLSLGKNLFAILPAFSKYDKRARWRFVLRPTQYILRVDIASDLVYQEIYS